MGARPILILLTLTRGKFVKISIVFDHTSHNVLREAILLKSRFSLQHCVMFDLIYDV